jgi:hypothetical protein
VISGIVRIDPLGRGARNAAQEFEQNEDGARDAHVDIFAFA